MGGLYSMGIDIIRSDKVDVFRRRPTDRPREYEKGNAMGYRRGGGIGV